jgi:hypothetical protein
MIDRSKGGLVRLALATGTIVAIVEALGAGMKWG